MITKSEIYKINFMAENPLPVGKMKNIRGQEVEFYEHPRFGDEDSIYGMINGVLFDTEFFDTEDMTNKDSYDYQPILTDGRVICFFEV